MADDFDERKARIAKIIRENARPARTGDTINVTGDSNVIAPNSKVTIVVKNAQGGRAAAKPKPREWREELLGAVREKAETLGLTEEQLCEIAAKELRKTLVVFSLERLQADDLARLYESICALKRPALD